MAVLTLQHGVASHAALTTTPLKDRLLLDGCAAFHVARRSDGALSRLHSGSLVLARLSKDDDEAGEK